MESRRYSIIYTYEESHWWYKGRRFFLENILNSLNLPKNSKILDIGCGGGFNLNILRKFGEISGVDIEPKSIEYCKLRGFKNVRLIKKNSDKLPFRNNQYNLITCLDVLEHIDDDEKYLKEVNRILLRDGYLIIFVPSFQILWGELDDRSKHFRRYRKGQLISMLKKSGFQVKFSRYFNFIFFLPILLVRLGQKLPFGERNRWGIDPIIESSFINKVLTAIFFLDISLARWISPPFGISVCLVAKKI
ncbi:hypothetical protein A3B45_00315 [Candidatus Daviesbacteria bacterium RIFCSPLOWO2_01_FULL_39_12]|uniref:Methyltransferase type 11 domain-containing protein n=1 Tax=Candidatus Daviesbacteria bacterium RIFCSPLOWO2_01_FULL_39_12 TaxID=1797785 RepID=A0A1F5KNW0_9BACT|nr:MAG: hypothetical protein A3D79_00885 [Candidatus Daviesbacteria bacterium RIFCSPHIGHO2_02_FULL_39_8]OGE42637.1 MAG: hypothetical protein A3B45_00315 [Candidatus Daviesbacteria bacterium RIFCSPLOWO2_01_FULL_39_12]